MSRDWPDQESYSERENLPRSDVNQFNLMQSDQRDLENPSSLQNRPSVIKAVKDKSQLDKTDQITLDPEVGSKTENVCDIENNALIIKYIHKKFSWKTLGSNQSTYVPSDPNSLRSSVIVGSSSTSLATEFNDIFKQEESNQDMENIGSTVDFEDLKLEGPSDIQAICLTYLAEDIPYLEEKKDVFLKAWYEINLGETVVEHFIAFARDGVPLSRNFHVMAQSQMR